MNDRIDKQQLIRHVAQRTARNEEMVAEIVDATLEEIYQALKRTETVSLRDFGTFYIDVRRSGTVFKFNPSQRLRALFGWSSTYRGTL